MPPGMQESNTDESCASRAVIATRLVGAGFVSVFFSLALVESLFESLWVCMVHLRTGLDCFRSHCEGLTLRVRDEKTRNIQAKPGVAKWALPEAVGNLPLM